MLHIFSSLSSLYSRLDSKLVASPEHMSITKAISNLSLSLTNALGGKWRDAAAGGEGDTDNKRGRGVTPPTTPSNGGGGQAFSATGHRASFSQSSSQASSTR